MAPREENETVIRRVKYSAQKTLTVERIQRLSHVGLLEIVPTGMIGLKLFQTEHCTSSRIKYRILVSIAAGVGSMPCYHLR